MGSKVLSGLLERNAPLRVIARTPVKLPAGIRDRAEIIEGSHGEASVVERAFKEPQPIWLAPLVDAEPGGDADLDFTRPAAAALQRHQVARIVTITAIGRGTAWQDQRGPVTASIRMDETADGDRRSVSRPGRPSFMENTARQAGATSEPARSSFVADRQLPFTATRDMAAAAVRLLADTRWDGQQEAPLLGPDDLSFDDQATILSDVVGRPVRYQQISFDQFKQQSTGAPASPWRRAMSTCIGPRTRGFDNSVGRTPENTGPTHFCLFSQMNLKALARPGEG
ncbi:MAG: NAD(P)H-binding protein [Mesorhizobium sp.]